ncbi:MAG: hypothetical protein ACC645_01050 [Pirellulales bacterium]
MLHDLRKQRRQFETLERRYLLAFNIQFDWGPNVTEEARGGFEAAAEVWESLLEDDISVRIAVDLQNGVVNPTTGQRAVASANAERRLVWYADVREALKDDVRSEDDELATDWLQGGAFAHDGGEVDPEIVTPNYGVPVTARRLAMNTEIADVMIHDLGHSYQY